MKALSRLLAEVQSSIERGSGTNRAQTLSRITDLFLLGADQLSEEQIDLFDTVISRFVAASELQARATLSERLAPSDRAPRNVLRKLAHDEIVVARPILTRSTRLDDQDLMAVAVARGQNHMLAISERAHVSENVTDILVGTGSASVRRAVTRNPGARFSALSTTSLIEVSSEDEELQELLGERRDLTESQMRELVAVARETARRRLVEALPRGENEVPSWLYGPIVATELTPKTKRNYELALSAVQRLGETGYLSEKTIAGFATERRWDETVAAMAYMTGLPIAYVERLFADREDDTLLVIGRCQNWSWATVRAFLQLRNPTLNGPKHLWRLEEKYTGLAVSTAQKVVHFIKLREASPKSAEDAPPVRGA